MPFTIIRQDITKMHVDAIVNAANSGLKMGGGVCGAIFKAAGAQQMQAACEQCAPVGTGSAAITSAFALPCQYVIHAVGPVYRADRAEQCGTQLYAAYTSALRLAAENGCASIAFPLISSGIFGYPKADALRVASAAIQDFLEQNDMEVYLAVFNKEAFSAGLALMGKVEAYIDENYVQTHRDRRRRFLQGESLAAEWDSPNLSAAPSAFAGMPPTFAAIDRPFNETLLALVDAKGMTDPEVYKRANIDRKLFNKIKNNSKYMPGKRTVIALAIGLRLSLEETEELLKCAGYALSHSQLFDVIVEYFIVHGEYDYMTINEVLFQYDQALLGTA